MTCQNAAEKSNGLRCARLCRSATLRWDNFTLRTASSPRRTSRLRPYGLSTLGIRDTGQNASQEQDAFRSLHYVAETCLPPSACLAFTKISTPHFGDRPHVAWGQAPKSVLKNRHYSDVLRGYHQNGKKENLMRNILKLILLRSKKV